MALVDDDFYSEESFFVIRDRGDRAVSHSDGIIRIDGQGGKLHLFIKRGGQVGFQLCQNGEVSVIDPVFKIGNGLLLRNDFSLKGCQTGGLSILLKSKIL